MSRIRTIKPEFWTSDDVTECSRDARLLFIGLWNFCDDAGRHPASPKQVKACVLPTDEVPLDTVAVWLDELETNHLIQRYDVNGKPFLRVLGWKHQKINKPQEPRYPGPPDEPDDTVPEPVTEQSPTIHAPSLADPISKGAEQPRARFIEMESQCMDALGIGIPLSDFDQIIALTERGYDLSKDILPKLAGMGERGLQARSWRYFVPAITEAEEAKRKLPAKEPPKPMTFIATDDPRWPVMLTKSGGDVKPLPNPKDTSQKGNWFPDDWLLGLMPPMPATLKRTAA